MSQELLSKRFAILAADGFEQVNCRLDGVLMLLADPRAKDDTLRATPASIALTS